jgi:hypothetical protein
VNSELPRPYIAAIEPSAIPIGTDKLVLTITGRDFHADNRVMWDGKDLHVLDVTPTTARVAVPKAFVTAAGTYKVTMITGGRVRAESVNFGEVMVTFGRTFQQRWNGQALSKIF